MIRFALFALCGMSLAPAFAPLCAGDVSFAKQGDDVVVSIDGKEFSRYRTGENWPKPFFHPVLMDGTDITRPVDPNEKEHPHHKGIWVSVDEVNGIKFWAEKGKIVNVEIEWMSGSGDKPGTLSVVNHWRDAADQTVVLEHTTIRIHANKLLAYDITFEAPADSPVVFEDTKEGLLGFRMAQSMRESEGGKVLGANGAAGSPENWGKPNPWIDYHGLVDGKRFGVALMDHPENFRPSRYHVRNYGLFSLSPFGEKSYTNGKEEEKPVHLQPGGKLRLRYAIYFHAGDTAEGNVAEAFRQFVESK